ncbi:MAG TPA: lactonase family protein [Puia sp.]
MRRLFGLFLGALLSMGVHAQPATHYYLLVGSYTEPRADRGIFVYDFDTGTGELRFLSVTGGIASPSYLAVGFRGDRVYAVSEKDHGEGRISAYKFDSGRLTLLNDGPSGGRGPCYISADDAGTHVFAANYGSGSLGVTTLNRDGSLDTTATQSIQHLGGSINAESQTRPHAHSVLPAPDNRFVLSANLGNDRVYVYRFDRDSAVALRAADSPYLGVTPGSGPRHICFDPSGKHMYVVNEMGGGVDVFDYREGTLHHKQAITMLPEGFSGIVEAADIHLSPDGKFLYASNREVRNEIVIYSVGPDGSLRFAGRQSVLGTAPRSFVIDPLGHFLLTANLKTNEIVVFRRDAKTGLLSFTGKKTGVNAPACLKFVLVHE